MIGWACMLDAVLIEELSMLVACYQVLLILPVIAHAIWFLYAPARRSVISGDGKPNQAAVRETNLLLHKTLSERAAANNGATVVVLYGSGENL